MCAVDTGRACEAVVNECLAGIPVCQAFSRTSCAENFKQRYDATVLVKYSDGTKCMYSARIRHHGDEKDHIDLLGNTIE